MGTTARTEAADGRAGSRHVRTATAAERRGTTLMWMLIFLVFALLFAAAVSVLSAGMLTLILIPLSWSPRWPLQLLGGSDVRRGMTRRRLCLRSRSRRQAADRFKRRGDRQRARRPGIDPPNPARAPG